jgi:excisionase family DNA binding protein
VNTFVGWLIKKIQNDNFPKVLSLFCVAAALYACVIETQECHMTERLLSPTEMAERLACSRPMVYKLINQGKLPPLIKLGERMSRVREADFDAAVQQLSQT